MGRVGAGLTLTQQAINVLRKYGTDAHVYLPGIGVVNGLTAGNWIDTAGTQAAVVDSTSGVGLALDAANTTLGSERVVNGDFGNGSTGWVFGTGWAVTGGKAVATAVANGANIAQTVLTDAANKTFSITFTVSDYVSGQVRPQLEGVQGSSVNANGTYTQILTAAINTPRIFIQATAAGTSLSVDNISVREITGSIPATQGTTANKPILRRGYVNRCLLSESFSNVAWATSGASKTSTNNTDPSGGSTALLLTSDSNTNPHFLTGSVAASAAFISGLGYTQSIYLKAGTVSRAQLTFPSAPFGSGQYANFGLTGSGSVLTSAGGAASIQSVGGGWYRCAFTATATTTTTGVAPIVSFINSDTASRLPNYAGNASDTILVAFGQLETGSTATPYIPTTSAAASASVGNYWWEFDGTDFLSLAAAPFSLSDDFAIGMAVNPSFATSNLRMLGVSGPGSVEMYANGTAGTIALRVSDGTTPVFFTNTLAGNVFNVASVVSMHKSGSAYNTRRNLANQQQVGTSSYTAACSSAAIGASVGGGTALIGSIFGVYFIKAATTQAERDILDRWLASGASITL